MSQIQQIGEKEKTTVIVDFDVEGFHYFPEPPDEVSFLRFNHRHLFRIRIGYQVNDMNRQREIFIEERYARSYIETCSGVPANFHGMSCEMIASNLLDGLQERGAVWAEVLEDGRGGARVER